LFSADFNPVDKWMNSLFPRTIQARLILSHLLVALVSIALISIYAGVVLFNAARKQAEHRYESLAFAATDYLEQPLIDFLEGGGSEEDISEAIALIFAEVPEVHYTVYLPTGSPVIDSSNVLPPQADPSSDPEIWEAVEDEIGGAEYIRLSAGGKETFFLAVRIERGGNVYGVLRIDVPLNVAMESARYSLALLIAIALLVALCVSAVGFFLARSLAGPIKDMTQAAENLSQGDLGARVESSNDIYEISRLAQAFNNMAGRLQAHVVELRSFVANASHELRTPLTSIKLRVEALRSGALDDPPVTERFLSEIESEVDRLSIMVNNMLDLSRIEAGLAPGERKPINLGDVIKEVYEIFKARAESSEISIKAEVEPGIPRVFCIEDQMRRMLYNLVDNAIKYTPRGGSVQLSISAKVQEHTVCLQVTDSGYGIAPEQLPRVFERFYRVEATRPRYGPPQGSGLGLAIAKSIAETHGGKIGVTSQLGKGSTFWVELPAHEK
jgi:signal transduction histidine kinase